MYERSSLRYAHTMGFTSLIYTSFEECIITCGSDGDIRRWRSIDDDDPSSNCLGEFVLCLAEKNGKLLAATDRNTVQSYTYPDLDKDGTLLRFTAPVICLKVSGNYLAAGSEDMKIQVLKDDTTLPLELIGHKGPVLALDIQPNGVLLASASGDGTIKIWDLENSGKELKTITGLKKANSYENAKYFGTPCFQPGNSKFLVYVKGQEVIVVNTSTWETQYTLSDNKVKGDYTCCQFSRDGTLLAAGTDKGEVSIFQFSTRQTQKCEAPSSECQAITCLAWSSKNNEELAYCDASGQLGTLFCNSDMRDDDGDAAAAHFINDEAEELDGDDFNNIEFTENTTESGVRPLPHDDNDDDGVSLEKLKNQIMSRVYNDDDDATRGSHNDDENSKDSTSRARSQSPAPTRTFKQQLPFQPSSTPTHLEHRYLVWNDVGIVTLHSDTTDDAIDVEFHDTSVHHTLHIPNCQNHNMASLSSNILALTSNTSSKLVCIALNSSGNKEWAVELPDCESVEAVVATTKLVAAATNMHFLRIFTVIGTQREVISIPGPVLCLAGYKDRILVCYHSAPAGIKQQHLSAMLLQTCGFRLKCQNITLPLAPERQLTWLGFSDNGSPAFSDSMGLLQLFSLKSNCWSPICDTMKLLNSVSNNYFILSLSERTQIVQAVLCRGTAYPMTNPRPMVQELPFQLPLCDLESEKSALEDTFIRCHFMSVDGGDRSIKEAAIKLFALACRSEVEMRAKELIETLASPDILNLAIKYATKLGRTHLSNTLYELLPQIEAQQQLCDENAQLIEQQLPASPLVTAQHNLSNGSLLSSHSKLAPKIMDISSAKKSTIKRLMSNNSPFSGFKKSTTDTTLRASSPGMNSEEIFINKSSETQSCNDDMRNISHSPAANPFASKRKISEVDKGSIVMGAERLKLIKK